MAACYMMPSSDILLLAHDNPHRTVEKNYKVRAASHYYRVRLDVNIASQHNCARSFHRQLSKGFK